MPINFFEIIRPMTVYLTVQMKKIFLFELFAFYPKHRYASKEIESYPGCLISSLEVQVCGSFFTTDHRASLRRRAKGKSFFCKHLLLMLSLMMRGIQTSHILARCYFLLATYRLGLLHQ